MNIPNLPTDNLYKFLAITGLFLMVASFGYKEYRNHQHNVENVQILVGKEILDKKIENQVRLMELSQKKANKELDLIESDTKKTFEENRKLYREALKNAYENLIEQADLDWYNIEGGELRLKSELADISVTRTKKLGWILNLAMVTGLSFMVSGFYLWHIKLQRYQDIILLKKSQESELNVEEEKESE